jgi:hypothetical protein
MYRLLFPAESGRQIAATMRPALPTRDHLPRTHSVIGDGCVVHIDGRESVHFDVDAVERGLPRLLRAAQGGVGRAKLEVRRDPEARPCGIEERSDRTVLWVPRPLSAREGKRLVGALVQRAHQSVGRVTLHATVVTRDNRAIAILGSYGAGKTLTSLRMCMGGATLIAGDVALISIDTTSVTAPSAAVLGGSREVWLDRSLRDQYFPHLRHLRLRGDAEGAPRIDVGGDLVWVPAVQQIPRLVAMAFVNVLPLRSTERYVTPLSVDVAALNLFRASMYRFDSMIESWGLSLIDLEPRQQRMRRVEETRSLARAVRTFRVGGSVESASEEVFKLLDASSDDS